MASTDWRAMSGGTRVRSWTSMRTPSPRSTNGDCGNASGVEHGIGRQLAGDQHAVVHEVDATQLAQLLGDELPNARNVTSTILDRLERGERHRTMVP